jgi:hypothetical protein
MADTDDSQKAWKIWLLFVTFQEVAEDNDQDHDEGLQDSMLPNKFRKINFSNCTCCQYIVLSIIHVGTKMLIMKLSQCGGRVTKCLRIQVKVMS